MKITAKPKFIYPSEPAHESGRFAVIDIGSSTMRLVIYDHGLYPHLFLNHKLRIHFAKEKGKGDFYLNDADMKRALGAVEWFLWVCKESSVTTVLATATSAVREAKNGADFVDAIFKKTGLHVEVISGEVEARLSAVGGMISLPDISGVVMDLGGGSLDICQTVKSGAFASLPLGVLSLRKLSEDNPYKAVEILKNALQDINWMHNQEGVKDLLALGSGMRSIASLHMTDTNYPMHILHDYAISAQEAIAYCDKFIKGEMSEKIAPLAAGYEDVLPYRAVALKAMLEVGEFKQVRFASFGIREGLFFTQMGKSIVEKDPLIGFAEDMAERDGRGVEYASHLAEWAREVFPHIESRILQVAALFSTVAWREQYTYRALASFEIVYGSPFVACSHTDRARLALMVYFTHADKKENSILKRVKGLVSKKQIQEAKQVGALFHLASFLDPGAKGVFHQFKLQQQADGSYTLLGPKPFMQMHSEGVAKRLEIFNKRLAS